MTTPRESGFRIAVISDLHVGDARAKDLYPSNEEGVAGATRTQVVDNNYVDKFIAFVNTHHIHADYLLVPGDVSHGGKPAQIAHAAQVLNRCATALKVPDDHVLFVPGNHDVNWDMLKLEDGAGVYSTLRYSGFLREQPIYHRVGSKLSQSLFQDPYYGLWYDDALYVVAYNTSWEDGPDAATPHHGYIDPRHLDEIRRIMDDEAPPSSQLKLFLLHHHPLQYSEPDGHRDFSALQNSEDLQKFLFDRGFHLVVHGHKHLPRLNPHWRGVGHVLAVLCAGSFSALMYPGWDSAVTNQFHIIEVAPASDTAAAAGFVRSWAYTTPRGWAPSRRDYTGIAHEVGFGSYPDLTTLSDALEALITGAFTGAGHIKDLAKLCAGDPLLKFAQQEQLRAALNLLEDKLQFDIMDLADESIALLKRSE